MKIEREIIDRFKEWKDSSNRKPILLQGARQIGKTWAMETLHISIKTYTFAYIYKI